jgi:hypothetical protein
MSHKMENCSLGTLEAINMDWKIIYIKDSFSYLFILRYQKTVIHQAYIRKYVQRFCTNFLYVLYDKCSFRLRNNVL